ncbi:MAG: hypothetical protein ACIAXF_05050 [Phycisphaerales bacterium JB063]
MRPAPKIRHAVIVAVVLPQLTAPALAQPADTSVQATPQANQAAEVEYAPTPTDLAELLGEGGVETVDLDFYLSVTATNDNPNVPAPEPTVLHWRVRHVEGGIAFYTGREASGGYRAHEEQVYSADGEFVSAQSETARQGSVATIEAVRDGDEVRVVNRYTAAGTINEPSEETFPYRRVEDALPSCWMPLAFAYQLRAGHEAFEMRFSEGLDDGDWRMIAVMRAQDVGTEAVEIGGETFQAHVLMITQTVEMVGEPPEGLPINRANRPVQEMLWHVLEDGTIVRMRMEGEGFAMQADAVTAEAAAALVESFE